MSSVIAPLTNVVLPREGGGLGPQTPATRVAPEAPAFAGEPAENDTALAKAARGFEAIFVRQMLAAARKSDLGGSDLTGGQGIATFRQMQDEQFADIAATRGAFGLARMIEAQLGARLGGGASTSSARAGVGSNTNPALPEPVEGPAQVSPKGE